MANLETSRALEMQAFSVEPMAAAATLASKTRDLQFFPTEEGFYDYLKDQYIYQYKDHLGNIRVSFGRNSAGALEITDSNDYYPFGMNHLKTGFSFFSPASAYKNYKYQGQELQEIGFYSFKWRNYMPDVGRFFNIDPLAEKYNTWTPYAFSGNRVIDARELEGLEPVEINKTTKNLVIVNQGYVGNPPKGGTQAQNFVKTNKDGGIDYEGIGIINNLNSSTNQVGVFGSSKGNITKNDILATIKSFRKQSPDGKLIMVGHSRGADNLKELANENPNIKIDLLFTLDIADTYDDDNIPPNVKTAINYYNKNDGFMGSSVGGEDIEAEDPSKTKIFNYPVSASHTQIDNKYRNNAYNAVVKELNTRNKPPTNKTVPINEKQR
ncbi:RHS repeat domain-containing protein [Chryseobacterium gregarium]|uniref:RHS repeat domain-containing protein n=1 Tax=Chryseobacterium gregarium TaxID=456299 RepID=UPI001E482231|nr:RHS repeat-associated core domain-containing protein [Chryseobacterium gregarium]